jgi:hypothetical protein
MSEPLRKAAEQALYSLENHSGNYKMTNAEGALWQKATSALRAALAEPEQEPVAWLIRIGAAPHWSYCEAEADADFYGKQSGMRYEKKPLYAAPPRREPLTDEEVGRLTVFDRLNHVEVPLLAEFIRHIEKAVIGVKP